MSDDLFAKKGSSPLADRMRPETLDEFVGQEEIVGREKPLTKILEKGGLPPSMVLWGPPGSGKTTLARIIAKKSGLHFLQFSAVTSGIKEVKEAIDQARWRRSQDGKPTILFVDELHRFNRAQQDAFLPHVEDGTIVLIGATTENPSFEVNSALLSRCRVFILRPLTEEEVARIVKRAADREKVTLEEEALGAITNLAGGDARIALNLVEEAASVGRTSTRHPSQTSSDEDASLSASTKKVTAGVIRDLAQRRVLRYDKDRDQHYDTISAFIKSMRGSDPDAALYWLARMLEAGEDPLFIARRMVIFASEDVGNADPRGIMVAVAVRDAVDFVGMPEAFYALSQGVTYLTTAPKSNASGVAYFAAMEDVRKHPNEPVPLHLRNAVTGLMREAGYGKGYEYAHDQPGGVVSHGHRPPNVEGHEYYKPSDRGHEAQIRKLMDERKTEKDNR